MLDYTDDSESHFSTASEATYDDGDLRIEHVACHGDGTNGKGGGQITIKNVSGGSNREYFYTLRGPVDNPENNIMTDAVGGATWNINGQEKPTPRPGQSSTWLTFPKDDPDHDPTKHSNLPAGTYWLVIENWDDREPNTPSPFENTELRACYVARKITMKEPAEALSASFTRKEYHGGMHVSCYASSDGEVTITPAGWHCSLSIPFRRGRENHRRYKSNGVFTGLAAQRRQALPSTISTTSPMPWVARPTPDRLP